MVCGLGDVQQVGLGVENVEVVAVDGDVPRRVEGTEHEAHAFAGGLGLSCPVAVRREALDAVVLGVDHVEHVVGAHREAARALELSGTFAPELRAGIAEFVGAG